MAERRVLVTGATDGIGEEIARAAGGPRRPGDRARPHAGARPQAALASGRARRRSRWPTWRRSRRCGRWPRRSTGRSAGSSTTPGSATAPRRRAAQRTEDGHEPTWQVNFLSAFLLTEALREQLRGGRVVHVSSGVHSSGEVDLEQPDEPRFATPYAQSKIALVMLAREQGERWAATAGRTSTLQPRLDRHEDGRLGRRRAAGRRRHAGLDAHRARRWTASPAATSGSAARRSRTRRPRTPSARRRLVELARARGQQGVARPGPGAALVAHVTRPTRSSRRSAARSARIRRAYAATART